MLRTVSLPLALMELLPPEMARREALGPLRWLAHRAAGTLAALPDAARLKRQYQGVLADNMARLVRAGEVVDAAAAAGVTLLPVKGVLLADVVYGDPGMRPMVDVDLLVRGEQLAAAEAVLA